MASPKEIADLFTSMLTDGLLLSMSSGIEPAFLSHPIEIGGAQTLYFVIANEAAFEQVFVKAARDRGVAPMVKSGDRPRRVQ